MIRRVIVRSQRATQLTRVDAVLAVVVHREVSSDEEGDIAARLVRQVAVDVPEVGAISVHTTKGTVHIARATVVCSEDEPPVAVDAVEVFEEAAGRLGALDGIHTLVDEAIDRESVDLTRREHELPEASGTSRRDGLRIECRLDDDEVAELHREAILVESHLDLGEVEISEGEHGAQEATALEEVQLDRLTYEGIVAESHRRGHLVEHAYIDAVWRVGDGHGAVAGACALTCSIAIAGVPLLQHLLHVLIKRGGEGDGIKKGRGQGEGRSDAVSASRAINLCGEAGCREEEEEGCREELDVKLHRGGV